MLRLTPVELTMFNPRVAAAVPVLAVTVQVVPEPVTPVMFAPVPPTREKFEVVTPVTEAENVTVQLTGVFTQVGLGELRLMELTVAVAVLFVKLKLTPVVALSVSATTVYGPPAVPLAVTAPLVAVPLLMVAGLPAIVQLAPLPGGVKVTLPPLTGSLLAELTVTLNDEAKAALVLALWLLPPTIAIVKPRDSYAPMSVVPKRAMPRWSVVGAPLAVPALIAGLPGSKAQVWVEPPLLAKAPNTGLVFTRSLPKGDGRLLSEIRLFPCETTVFAASRLICGELPERMVFLRKTDAPTPV